MIGILVFAGTENGVPFPLPKFQSDTCQHHYNIGTEVHAVIFCGLEATTKQKIHH
jgi:hypothetical protein